MKLRKQSKLSRFQKGDDLSRDYRNSSDASKTSTGTGHRLSAFLKEASEGSTIHGVKYIGSKRFHAIERIFWTIVTVSSLGGGIHLVLRLYTKYSSSPVITSFQHEETPISQIPFPAITICNVNMLKRSVINDFFKEGRNALLNVKAAGKDPTLDPEVLASAAHLDHLSQYCLSAPSFRRELNETIEDAFGGWDFGRLLNKYYGETINDSVTDRIEKVHTRDWWRVEKELFKNATISCKEMLLECVWSGQILPCMDLFFSVETGNGRCCVFNMMPNFMLQRTPMDKDRLRKEVEKLPAGVYRAWKQFEEEDLIVRNPNRISEIEYPKHQKSGGKPYGLSVLANPNLDEYSTCNSNDGWGFKIVAHSPLSYPAIINYGAAIPPNAEVFVDIEPYVTVADLDVLRDIELGKRGCYLPIDEQVKLQFYNFYSVENCMSECKADLIYRNCSCVSYSMPRNASQGICGAKSRPCLDEVKSNLNKGVGRSSFCSHCLPSCTEIEYKFQISHFEIRETSASSHYKYASADGQIRNATDYAIIHLFMGSDSIYAKERKTLYTKFDLIANAGGLLGLTLGMSIISFVEVFYFLTLRVWFHFKETAAKPKSTNSSEN